MRPKYTFEATYRPPNAPVEPPSLPAQAAVVAAPPALMWALTHPTAALLLVALVATVRWYRRAGGADGRPRPTGPPD